MMALPVVLDALRATPASGLGALPESWVPMGVHRCFASSPWGHEVARISRTPESIEFGLDHPESPQIVCTDLKDGRARVEIRMGCQGFRCSGPFDWWDDHAHFIDEDRVYSADLYRTLAGKIVFELHRDGQRLGIYFLLF